MSCFKSNRERFKQALLADYRPSNFQSDVWLLTERDEGTSLREAAVICLSFACRSIAPLAMYGISNSWNVPALSSFATHMRRRNMKPSEES